MRIGSDRLYEYPVDPGDFWVAASRTDLYQSWWPWLERFEAGALADGQVWTCSVRPPLPYTVSFSLELHDVCPGARVQARASGDIEGDARIDIEPADSGCRVRLRSQLSPSSLFLKTAAVVARPLVGLGHSWVLDTGARQFRTRAFAD